MIRSTVLYIVKKRDERNRRVSNEISLRMLGAADRIDRYNCTRSLWCKLLRKLREDTMRKQVFIVYRGKIDSKFLRESAISQNNAVKVGHTYVFCIF